MPQVFLAFANDNQTGLNLAGEGDLLENIFRDKSIQTRRLSSAHLDSVFEVFRNSQDIEIFHFSGHANTKALLFKDDQGNEQAVNGASFVEYLAHRSKLQLVFLNGCATQAHAQKLAEKGVPYVIATTHKIKDAVAIKFASYFYKNIAAGYSVPRAYAETKLQIRAFIDNTDLSNEKRRDLDEANEEIPAAEDLWQLYPNEQADNTWKLIGESPKLKPLVNPNFFLSCNREQQFQKFTALLESRLQNKINVCFVPGYEDGKHGSLMKRFMDHLQKEKKTYQIKEYQLALDWNPELDLRDLKENILRKTFKAFQMMEVASDVSNAQAILKRIPANSISLIHTTIKLNNEELFEEFIRFTEFWKVQTANIIDQNKRLFIFFNIIVEKDQSFLGGILNRFKFRKIKQFLKELESGAKERPKPEKACFPFLKAITIEELELFLRKHQLDFDNLSKYFNDKREVSMIEVEHQLTRIYRENHKS